MHGQRFNVGANDLNCTIAELAAIVARCVPGAVIVTHSQNGDQRSYRVRFDRIRDVLSCEPQRSLEDGIAEVAGTLSDGTVADYRQPIYHNALYLNGTLQGGGHNGHQA